MRHWIWLPVIVGLMCVGCVANNTRKAIERLAQWSTSEQLDEAIREVHYQSLLEERTWEIVFHSWGRRGASYDIGVLVILDRAGGHGSTAMSTRMADAVIKRLQEEPSLLRQVFWYDRWSGTATLEWASGRPYLVEYRSRLLNFHSEGMPYPSDRFCFVLKIASMLDEPQLIEGMTLANADRYWFDACRLLDNAPYYRFAESGAYTLDRAALASGVPVPLEAQQWTRPGEPLPE